jgi:transcriptional regulator with XRE-family HTH domain
MTDAAQATFAKDSWQTPRNARTLRAFMALRNQEIGARLRELRHGRPQTAVAEALEVSERAYQNWEAGDAKPSYRNLQRLAEYYGVGEDYILSGGQLPAETPAPFDGSIREQLAEMGKAIEKQADALVTQAGVLEELRDAVQDLRELIATQRAAARQMDEATKALEAATGRTRQPAGTAPRSGNTQKSAAAAPRPQTRP